MKTPPLLIASAILFWGWQTGLVLPAAIAALAAEAFRLTAWRMTLDDDGFSRVVTLSNILLAAAAVFSYAWQGKAGSMLTVIAWLPLILLPVLLAQLYSAAGLINPDVFFIFLKKNRANKINPSLISIAYPYIAICLLSGSVANVRSFYVYVLMTLICGWALYPAKPAGKAATIWLVIFTAASSVGYMGGVGLHALQKKVEEKFIEWYTGSFAGGGDYRQTTTSLGEVGRRKSSGDIILRVKADGAEMAPFHLAESSYDTFRSPSWFAVKAPMQPLKAEGKSSRWVLRGEGAGDKGLTLFRSLPGGETVIPLPLDAAVIEDLPVDELSMNRMGTVAVDHDPLFAAYRAKRRAGGGPMGAPTEADLSVPEDYALPVAEVAHGLGLRPGEGEEAVGRLTGFFLSNFTYSLAPEGSAKGARPLEDFLLRSRAGHCEYFAASTVLLLRSAGIPARYTVGYLVHEYSRLEKMYVVRERDAHAWVTAYLDGRWQTVDTTPPSWIATDGGSASFMEPLSDLRAWLQFLVARWRASGENVFLKYWYILLFLLAVLLWRLFGRERISLVQREKVKDLGGEGRPADSPFYRVEERLKALGHHRHDWESYRAWFERLEEEGRSGLSFGLLADALAMHTRMRFDPMGISESEMGEMAQRVREWLEAPLN